MPTPWIFWIQGVVSVQPVSRVLFGRMSLRGSHFSGSGVTPALVQPTRGVLVGVGVSSPPIWPCSDGVYRAASVTGKRGGLLPHRFTLATILCGGLFSVALSVTTNRSCPGITWRLAHGARTFLDRLEADRDCPTVPTGDNLADRDLRDEACHR